MADNVTTVYNDRYIDRDKLDGELNRIYGFGNWSAYVSIHCFLRCTRLANFPVQSLEVDNYCA